MKNKNQKIKLRKATQKDINQFWDVFKQSVKTQFLEYPVRVRKFFLETQYTKNHLKQWLKKGTITLLIAKNKNNVVGYLLANYPYGGVSFIIWLAVQNSFQKRGIGSMLLKEYEIIVKRKGVHEILLSATKKQNLKFYKKNGYKLVGYIPQNYFGIDNRWLYKKIQSPKINKWFS
jgi:ribosomal protein S18 acetylase RimI-like enzyme